jgi:hypothetical protein
MPATFQIRGFLLATALLAGTRLFAQVNGSEMTPHGGISTNADPLLFPPSYAECWPSSKAVVVRKDIYHDGWIDLNKNGKKDSYEDSTQPVEKRIDDLISQMTLEEKSGPLATLYGYQRVLKDYLPTQSWNAAFWKDGVANIDEDLTGYGADQGPPLIEGGAGEAIMGKHLENTYRLTGLMREEPVPKPAQDAK